MDSRSENEAFESSKNSVENEHSDIFIVPRIRKHRSCNYAQASIFLLCLTTSFCIILVAQQYSSKGRECVRRQSIYSPVLDVLTDDYQTWTFNGTFRDFSPYKGPPSDDVDRAWKELFSFGAFRITSSHLEKIGGSPIAAQFPPEAGGGYLGFMEVLHQLHCLVSVLFPPHLSDAESPARRLTDRSHALYQNLLWQYIYKDYYQTRSDPFKDSEPVLMKHLNHCADLLRQKIMCDADVGLIPMYWVKRHDHPYPDFSTQHKCRDFQAVWAWARENQVNMGKGWTGVLRKPEGAVELEMPP